MYEIYLSWIFLLRKLKETLLLYWLVLVNLPRPYYSDILVVQIHQGGRADGTLIFGLYNWSMCQANAEFDIIR